MLARPRLIVFSDTSRAPVPSLLARFDSLAQAARAGSVLFVVRDYGLSARARLKLAEEVQALARRSGQSFGVADRADFALALGADAFHLPESGIGIDDARRYLGSQPFISRACHEPRGAAALGTDAVLLSPIFAPRKGRAALGLRAIEQVCACHASSRVPAVYALGAVDAGNARACLDAGAEGVAVIGAALNAEPGPLLEALKISRH